MNRLHQREQAKGIFPACYDAVAAVSTIEHGFTATCLLEKFTYKYMIRILSLY